MICGFFLLEPLLDLHTLFLTLSPTLVHLLEKLKSPSLVLDSKKATEELQSGSLEERETKKVRELLSLRLRSSVKLQLLRTMVRGKLR